jgi:uncharacterized protein
MAVGSLLALLDDIATMLDDVAVMTKVAAKKTAGVLGDDLALNAQQVSGVSAERELPVVWAVAKGSFINKLILVPIALAMSYFAPWLIKPMLMLGGAYLCFEGFEKVTHKLLHREEDHQHQDEIKQAIENPSTDLVLIEKEKIKGAIRTDFILSAEIIVLALGTVANEVFTKQVVVVSIVAIVMTAGVYGVVAAIVKMDDLGLYMMLKQGSSRYKKILRGIGSWLLNITPHFMRALTILGTAAMFLVGGSIISHGLDFIHHTKEHIVNSMYNIPTLGGILTSISPIILDAVVGLCVGAICLLAVETSKKISLKKA